MSCSWGLILLLLLCYTLNLHIFWPTCVHCSAELPDCCAKNGVSIYQPCLSLLAFPPFPTVGHESLLKYSSRLYIFSVIGLSVLFVCLIFIFRYSPLSFWSDSLFVCLLFCSRLIFVCLVFLCLSNNHCVCQIIIVLSNNHCVCLFFNIFISSL